jgi:hypothetical protein
MIDNIKEEDRTDEKVTVTRDCRKNYPLHSA